MAGVVLGEQNKHSPWPCGLYHLERDAEVETGGPQRDALFVECLCSSLSRGQGGTTGLEQGVLG